MPACAKLATAGSAAIEEAASSPALGEVSLIQAISWSQDVANYSGLLVELAHIEEQLAASGAAMRREARLVPYLPTDTSAYFAIPNLDGAIEEAIRLIDERAPSNSALRQWWFSESGRSMRTMLERLQGVTALLGEEMVFVLTGSGEPVPTTVDFSSYSVTPDWPPGGTRIA